MKKLLLNIIPVLFMCLSACTKDSLSGDGSNITEDRTLQVQSGLQTIRVNGSTNIHIMYGSAYHLEVKGYANLVAALSTDIKNNTLVIEFPNHYNIKNDNTEIILTIPHLPNLYINGSIEADATGNFPNQADVFFQINGSGKINAGFINLTHLNVSISGSGDVNINNIHAKNAEISISGNGKVKTTVSDNLKASISGSGEIYYFGEPKVDSHISGSGKVSRLQ